jgi:hypothetical protein
MVATHRGYTGWPLWESHHGTPRPDVPDTRIREDENNGQGDRAPGLET